MEEYLQFFGNELISEPTFFSFSSSSSSLTERNSTPFNSLIKSSGSQGTIVAQVIRTKFLESCGRNNTPMFNAWLLDLSPNSQHGTLGDARVGKPVLDEMALQVWGSDAQYYNRDIAAGDVIELQNYSVGDAFHPKPYETKLQLTHKKGRSGSTIYTILSSRITPLSTAEVLSRLYVSPSSISIFSNWEKTDGPEKWNTYTVLGIVTYASSLCPPSDGGKNMTRKLCIIDDTSHSINVLLIGKIAERFSCIRGDIIMLYNFQISDTWLRSLRGFDMQAHAAIILPADELDPTPDSIRDECIMKKTNPFCENILKRLKQWRAENLGEEKSIEIFLSNKDFRQDENYEIRTLEKVSNNEYDKLNSKNPGTLRHVIIAQISEIFDRYLFQMICDAKGCTYAVNWVPNIGKWVCCHPSLTETPLIPDFSKEKCKEYKWTGHIVSRPQIRFSVQGNICDMEGTKRCVYFGDNSIQKLFNGISAESWAVKDEITQQKVIKNIRKTIANQWWKMHGSSFCLKIKNEKANNSTSDLRNKFRLKIISIEPIEYNDAVSIQKNKEKEEKEKEKGNMCEYEEDEDEDDYGNHKRIVIIKRQRDTYMDD